MEHGTVQGQLKEQEIKPSPLLDEYRKLIQAEALTLLSTGAEKLSNCLSCDSAKLQNSFSKNGFQFSRCEECFSIWSAIRPSPEGLRRYFLESKARTFWHDRIWNETRDSRMEKVVRPTVRWIETHLEETFPNTKVRFAEWAGEHPGFEKEFDAVPLHPLYRSTKPQGDAADTFQAIGLFQSLNRSPQPETTLKAIHQSLATGGLVFVTASLSTGLDILELGTNSPSFNPPDQLNLFSIEGLTKIFERTGYEVIESSTPGLLDFQNLEEAYRQGLGSSPFWEYLFRKRWKTMESEEKTDLTQQMQNLLQTFRLSSTSRWVIKKKK